jgi:hypothetical protein
VRRELAIGLLCGGLAACALPLEGPPIGYPPPVARAGNLHGARLACNNAYPARIGNYVPHANCVNAAVERFAPATARYPDLIHLQEQARVQISSRIDSRAISVHAGEAQMAEADRAITTAEHERNAARPLAANAQIARVQAILQE